MAADFGFNVTHTGIGARIVNVGNHGTAFEVADDSDLTIMQLLQATDSMTDRPCSVVGYASIYDQNGDGVVDSVEAALRAMANDLYTEINEEGDI